MPAPLHGCAHACHATSATKQPTPSTIRPTMPGGLLRLQRGQRQRAVRDELALRDEDHARHREHEHQREREQRIDRAVGDAVLREQSPRSRGPYFLVLKRKSIWDVRGGTAAARPMRKGEPRGTRAAVDAMSSNTNAMRRHIAVRASASTVAVSRSAASTCRRRSAPSPARACRGRCGRSAWCSCTPCATGTSLSSRARRAARRGMLACPAGPSSALRESRAQQHGRHPTRGRRTSRASPRRTPSRTSLM